MLVYVAGPLGVESKDQIIAQNIERALRVSAALLAIGVTPVCPHLMYYGHRHHEMPCNEEEAMEWCLKLLAHCDALVRLPGNSVGADLEVDFAYVNEIMVYTIKKDLEYPDLEDLFEEVFKELKG